jgi:hypothetical protein
MAELVEKLIEIDARWHSGNPILPSELLQACKGRWSDEEAIELLAADSEWRWRSAGINVQPVGDPAVEWNDLRPRFVEVYQKIFANLTAHPQSLRRLIETEFTARSRWGDFPLIREFKDRFSKDENIEPYLQACLEEVGPLQVMLKDNHTEGESPRSVYYVRSPLSIGRQSASEPRDQLILEQGHRIIVANNTQQGVSRKHAIVLRQSVDRCLVENVSRLGEMKVNGKFFPPGWSHQLLMPLTMEIGDRELVLFYR